MSGAGGSGELGGSGETDAIGLLVGAARALAANLAGGDAGELVAIGWATVDIDRASVELEGRLEIAPPGPPSEEGLLSARARSTALGGTGIDLVLLEPAREGPLAAFLARHGEGIAALYLRAGPGGGPASQAVATSPGSLVAGPASDGSARRIAGGRDGPFLILVGRATRP